MSWGFSDARRAERRRRRLRVVKFFTVLGGLVALGAVAYQSGAELVRVEVASLREEIRRQAATISGLNTRIGELEQARQAALNREAEANARYQREVPSGPGAELYRQLQARLAGGITPERMAFVIRTATSGDKCENRPATRRFQVSTPTARTASAVSFDNAVVVTAEGEAAVAEGGAPQAWFDPRRPVRVAFTAPGGARSEASGMLPLFHSVVRGAVEYRFAVTEADIRGFIVVTADKCEYP